MTKLIKTVNHKSVFAFGGNAGNAKGSFANAIIRTDGSLWMWGKLD